jgi:beta-galactosidase
MFPHFIYGGDYNPDQWPEAIWEEDVRLMQEAGVNLVSLGIFSWSKLEPQPGIYNFEWLDRIIELLYAHGISIDLATPTASPPPWLARLDPGVLPVTADGVRLGIGSRRHVCPHNATYREHAARMATQLAQRYHDHPALALWHIDNEYACHVGECFCETSAQALRQWLQTRYGTLDALNEVWGTTFWSQQYGDWQEIQPPRRAPAFINPSQTLDWQRFCSASWLACFEDQRAILREITPDIPLTTNFMGFHKPLDYWTWAAREDIVSNDAYPDTSESEWMIGSAMVCDLIRSLGKGRPWLLMEQAPTHVNWRVRNATKRPGVMRLGSYQAIARGANGVMFFQWRASQFGAEKFHSAMLPHAGTDTRVWREAKALGAELKQLDGLLKSEVHAEVAILFDWESWWALEQEGKPLNDLRLMPLVKAYYTTLYQQGVTIDFAHPNADLSQYRVVIAPQLYLLNDQAVQNITQYVANGGTLLMSFFSGIVDEHDHVRLGGYPAPFQDLLGMHVEEFAPYALVQTNEIRTVDGQQFSCTQWSDIIQLHGAESLAAYRHDYYAETPAITRHPFGQGVGYYVGTQLDDAGLSWLLNRVSSEAKVSGSPTNPIGVEIIQRNDDTHTWLFALNYSDQPVEIKLDRSGRNVISGQPVERSITLGSSDVAIIQSPLS